MFVANQGERSFLLVIAAPSYAFLHIDAVPKTVTAIPFVIFVFHKHNYIFFSFIFIAFRFLSPPFQKHERLR